MKTDEVKIQTWADLKEFLDKQPEELLQKRVSIMIDDEDNSRLIEEIQVLSEDHVNPTGVNFEPVSEYLQDSGGEYDIVGIKGQFFFSIF
jgi:hypothetical protein